jgi:fructokinase
MRLLGIGEVLWDVIGAEEHLGGAVFNLCAHAARVGHEVSLVSAVADDSRGERALARARELGVSTRFIRTVAQAPTGIVTVAIDAAGQPSYVIERPAAYDFAALDAADLAQLDAAPPDWICFGTLFPMNAKAKELLESVVRRFPRAHRLYDVNLRKDSYTTALVQDLLRLASIVKLNDFEVDALQEMFGTREASLEQFCRSYAQRLKLEAICVTRGSKGSALLWRGQYEEASGYPVAVADTVGAGDAFAAALIHAMDAGLPPREAADFANRLGAVVASRRGAVPEWTAADLEKP